MTGISGTMFQHWAARRGKDLAVAATVSSFLVTAMPGAISAGLLTRNDHDPSGWVGRVGVVIPITAP